MFHGNFINNLPAYVKFNTKGVVATLFEMNDWKHNVIIEVCARIKREMNKLDILCRFMMLPEFYVTSLLVAAEYKPKVEKSIVIVICHPNEVQIIELLRKMGKYRITRKSSIKSVASDAVFKNTIVGQKTFDQIIIGSIAENSKVNLIKRALNSINYLVIDGFVKKYIPKAVEAIIQGICEVNTQFHIEPICGHTFVISEDSNLFKEKVIEFSTQPMDYLPMKKEFELPKTTYYFLVQNLYPGPTFYSQFDKCVPEAGCGKTMKISLNIDNDGFPIIQNSIKLESDEEYKIFTNFCNKLNRNNPMILFNEDGSFVLAIWNKIENKFNSIDDWNGDSYKNGYITFDGIKPKFNKIARQIYKDKPSYVVYDLHKIMSMSPDEIKVNQEWKFKILRSKKHPILIEFDYFDGTRKASTPAFLFALLLKQHLKIIKRETGTKPSEISFVFNAKDATVFERIEAQIQKSCNMLNISCQCLRFQ